jgi:S1-C subfamily serine protease
MVVTIDPAGPAHAAGLLQGDILVALDGEAVTGGRGIYQRLGPDSVGRKVAVELLRAGAPTTAQVTIAARSHG